MSLKFRRNLPLLLLFMAIVAILVLGLGSQPIVAYSIERDSSSGSQAATGVDLIDESDGLAGLNTSADVDITVPTSDSADSPVNASLSGDDAFSAQDLVPDVDLTVGDLSTFQPDEG